jgi:hypothetical protein
LDGDRELALLVRLGTPTTINYEGYRQKPFWRIREKLSCYLLERELHEKSCFAHTIRAACSQGFPSKDFNVDLFKEIQTLTQRAVRIYTKAVMPWLEDSDLSSEEDLKAELLGEAPAMIEAWLERFEPENLQAYRESIRERMMRAGGHGGS